MPAYILGSNNVFNINGGYSANTVWNEPKIKVENNKLISDDVQDGASCWAIFDKEYPAGTYTLCMSVETNDTSNHKNSYRFATSTENNVGTYLEYYKAWYKDVQAGTPITFTTTKPFKLLIFFVGNAASYRAYYDIVLNRGSVSLPFEEYAPEKVLELSAYFENDNLLKIGNRIPAPYDSGVGLNTNIRNFTENYYYVGMTSNNYWFQSNVSHYLVGENRIEVRAVNRAYGIAFPIKCKPNTVYALSVVSASIWCSLGFYTENGEWLTYSNDITTNTISFTTPENCGWFTICFRLAVNEQTSVYTDIIANPGAGTLPYIIDDLLEFDMIPYTRNLFDVYKLQGTAGSGVGRLRNNNDGSFTMSTYNARAAQPLGYYAPLLEAGKTYTLSMKTDSPNNKFIYVYAAKPAVWRNGESRVMTEAMINSVFLVYGDTAFQSNPNYTPTNIWDFGIYEGSTVQEYEPPISAWLNGE